LLSGIDYNSGMVDGLIFLANNRQVEANRHPPSVDCLGHDPRPFIFWAGRQASATSGEHSRPSHHRTRLAAIKVGKFRSCAGANSKLDPTDYPPMLSPSSADLGLREDGFEKASSRFVQEIVSSK
jgi:hypothetical protein